MGYSLANTVLVGDSAGRNPALTLTQYLVENKNTPNVSPSDTSGNLILLSPGQTQLLLNTTGTFYYLRHRGQPGIPQHWAQTILNMHPRPFWPRIRLSQSPHLHCFIFLYNTQAHSRGFPRTFLDTATAGRLYDGARTLGKKMAAKIGEGLGEGRVTYFEGKVAVHDFLVFRWHPRRPAALKAIQRAF
ncbi:hypothetical protein J3R82DRAFT_10406 [Butyriboletus roseoflavus]|nr:hypothetical protein J3R82DRAFT_10406 [Butyriboletus roseoflavus]